MTLQLAFDIEGDADIVGSAGASPYLHALQQEICTFQLLQASIMHPYRFPFADLR